MFELDAQRFYEASYKLSMLATGIQSIIQSTPDATLDGLRRESGADWDAAFEALGHAINGMGLPLTKKAFDRLRQVQQLPPLARGAKRTLGAPIYDIREEASALLEVAKRFGDELESRWFLALSPIEGDLYMKREPVFGRSVEAAFPLASEDISEAAKCLSLGRFTAAVFHLMRAMERALYKMGETLGATILDKHDRNLPWGIILANIDAQIAKMPISDTQKKWSEARALLYHVNQAWRTETMHPKQTYAEREAQDVFSAVRSFMTRLAALVS